MPLTRRSVLAGGAALLAGCAEDKPGAETADPAPERSAEPTTWEAPGTLDEVAFAWGIQTGDASPDSVMVSVRTTEAKVHLVTMAPDGEGWREHATTELVVTDGVAQGVVDGLAADTPYALAAYSADGKRRTRVGRVRTALATDGWRVVTFGATSCLGGNEPWPNLSLAAAENLDFFALLGDTIYADSEPDVYDYEAKWSTALSTEGLRAVTASTSVVATWDDHEVDNNYDEATTDIDTHFADGLAAFHRALPLRGGSGRASIWRKLSWGRVLDLFVLDCRGERQGGLYVSEEQMAWLKSGLAESTARFKIILNSVPITDYLAFMGETQLADRWSGYPEQRSEILSFVADNAVAGVLWLSGDFHMAQVGRVDPEGGVAADQWEVLAGPSGSFLNVLAKLYVGDPQYPILFAAWNYTWLRCDPAAGTVEVRFVGDDGTTLAETTLDL